MKSLVATGCLIASASAAALATREATTCPGYKATNVKANGGSISADLSLAGAACNVYGTDLDKLVLQVEYETGRRPQSK